MGNFETEKTYYLKERDLYLKERDDQFRELESLKRESASSKTELRNASGENRRLRDMNTEMCNEIVRCGGQVRDLIRSECAHGSESTVSPLTANSTHSLPEDIGLLSPPFLSAVPTPAQRVSPLPSPQFTQQLQPQPQPQPQPHTQHQRQPQEQQLPQLINRNHCYDQHRPSNYSLGTDIAAPSIVPLTFPARSSPSDTSSELSASAPMISLTSSSLADMSALSCPQSNQRAYESDSYLQSPQLVPTLERYNQRTPVMADPSQQPTCTSLSSSSSSSSQTASLPRSSYLRDVCLS